MTQDNKYVPKKIKELVGNKTSIKNIVDWLNTFDTIKSKRKNVVKRQRRTKEKSCLFITGSHGTGKSCAVNVIINELGFTAQSVQLNEIKTEKNAIDVMNKIKVSNNIIDIMKGNMYRRPVIMIDCLESITSHTEKKAITYLIKANTINWICPIIFIANNQHNKSLSYIKKFSNEVLFRYPSILELSTLIKRIIKLENMSVANDNIIYKIIEHSQSDMRMIINIIEHIKYVYEVVLITNEIINEYCTSSKKKDIEFDLIKTTDKLIYGYTTMEECLQSYEMDKVLIPLMIHENYISSIISNSRFKKNSLKAANRIAGLLSTADVIENHIYGEQSWSMQGVHGYYTCIATSYEFGNILRKKKNQKYEFTGDFNKTTIKKINRKNILKVGICLKQMDIFDYLYVNKLIREFISNDDMKECLKLLYPYHIKLDHIEALLKIDKINSIKSGLTTRHKKELKEYI